MTPWGNFRPPSSEKQAPKLEVYSKRMTVKLSSPSLGTSVHLSGQLLAGVTHLRVLGLKFYARVWLHRNETAWHVSLNPGVPALCASTPSNISNSPAPRAGNSSPYLPWSLLLRTIWSLESSELQSNLNSSPSSSSQAGIIFYLETVSKSFPYSLYCLNFGSYPVAMKQDPACPGPSP